MYSRALSHLVNPFTFILSTLLPSPYPGDSQLGAILPDRSAIGIGTMGCYDICSGFGPYRKFQLGKRAQAKSSYRRDRAASGQAGLQRLSTSSSLPLLRKRTERSRQDLDDDEDAVRYVCLVSSHTLHATGCSPLDKCKRRSRSSPGTGDRVMAPCRKRKYRDIGRHHAAGDRPSSPFMMNKAEEEETRAKRQCFPLGPSSPVFSREQYMELQTMLSVMKLENKDTGKLQEENQYLRSTREQVEVKMQELRSESELRRQSYEAELTSRVGKISLLERNLSKEEMLHTASRHEIGLLELKVKALEKAMATLQSAHPPGPPEPAEPDAPSRDEVAALKEKLRKAQAHIFSLQPYRTVLTPDRVKADFDGLTSGVSRWVETYVGAVADDEALSSQVLAHARTQPGALDLLRSGVRPERPDILQGAEWAHMAEPVAVAMVMDFFCSRVIRNDVAVGLTPEEQKMLDTMQHKLESDDVQPKRGTYLDPRPFGPLGVQ